MKDVFDSSLHDQVLHSSFILPPSSLWLLGATFHDELCRPLVPARLVALGRLAPRRDGVAAAGSLPLTSAQRVIDGIHRHAAVVGHLSEVTGAAGLADGDVLVLQVADLPDGRVAA